MTALAVLLAAVGAADLAGRWRQVVGLAVAVVLPLLLGAGWHTLWIAGVVGVVVVVWIDAAEQRRLAGTGLLAITTVAFVLASPGDVTGRAPIQGWYDDLPVDGLRDVSLDQATLVLGALLFLTTAASIVVRQALQATGPTVLEQETSLRGGRLLGPIERWLVLGFALSGNVAVLGALAAAKGILRFPEISRDEPDGMRAEYVLVGSFVSWTLALAVVPLV